MTYLYLDLEGSGSTQVSSRLTSEYREELEFDGDEHDRRWREEAGKLTSLGINNINYCLET